MLSTRTQARKRREDQRGSPSRGKSPVAVRQLAAVRRFGAEGLKLSFKAASSAEPTLGPGTARVSFKGRSRGANHGIDVLLTDSIRDFKALKCLKLLFSRQEKVSVACANESRRVGPSSRGLSALLPLPWQVLEGSGDAGVGPQVRRVSCK